MRKLAPLALALVMLAACGKDADPDNRPGSAGAFGSADDCTELVAQTVDAYRAVLRDLGRARRTDTERIDRALESFGQGPDLAVRYDGLGCDSDASFDTAVCAAAADLQAAGPAAHDLLTTLRQGCQEH